MRISDWSSDGCSSDLLSLAQLRDIYQQPVTLSLDASASAQIEASVACVEQILAENRTAYGINTGFGLLDSTRIASEDPANLQRSLVLFRSEVSRVGKGCFSMCRCRESSLDSKITIASTYEYTLDI